MYLVYRKYFYKGDYTIAEINNSLLNELLLSKRPVYDILKDSNNLYIGKYIHVKDSIDLKLRKDASKVGMKYLPKKELFYDKDKKILYRK
jgi:hypothetical protein